MSTMIGWNVDPRTAKKVTLTVDVSEGLLVTAAGALCGAAGIPAGVVKDTVDISEDGTTVTVYDGGKVKGLCAAAITSLTTPIKPAADGTITPADTDKDFCVGFPDNLQATVGGEVSYTYHPFYYAV